MEDTLRIKINEWKTSRGLPPYSEKTIESYLTNVRKLAPPNYEDMSWAKSSENVAQFLSKFKPTTQRNYYNSLLICLYASGYPKNSGLTKVYETKRDLLNAQYENTRGNNSEKQQVVLQAVNRQTIDKMLEKMRGNLKDRTTHMAYVMINIYKHHQFRNDVANMEIFFNKIYEEIDEEEKVKHNYLLLGKPPESMSFVLNQYKTSKKYGEKFIEVQHPELQDILKEWINRKVAGDWNKILEGVIYLFDWATGTPLNRNDVSHLLGDTFKKYTGHSVSTTLLRKIYGEIPADPNSATDKQIQKVIDQAHTSGHSVKTKATSYTQGK